jgi:hypothetical protein
MWPWGREEGDSTEEREWSMRRAEEKLWAADRDGSSLS